MAGIDAAAMAGAVSDDAEYCECDSRLGLASDVEQQCTAATGQHTEPDHRRTHRHPGTDDGRSRHVPSAHGRFGSRHFIPDEIASRLDSAKCIQGLISAGTLDEEASGSGMAAAARCIGAVAGGVVASIIGIVTDGGAALWTQLEGAIRTVLSADDVSFEVAEIPADAIGDGSPIPVDQVRGMLGTWKGPINQTGSRKYSVLLSLRHDGRTVVGSVAYPELRCNGYLHAAKLMSGTLHIAETITKNGSCVEEVPLELTLQGDKLHYHFDGGRRHGEGTGLLTRQQ